MKLAYTISTISYLHQAKVLADSFLIQNPLDRFCICILESNLTDNIKSYLSGYEYVGVGILPTNSYSEMRIRYSNSELCYATKPYFGKALLEKETEIDGIIYFDGDMIVTNYIELFDVNSSYFDSQKSIFLTPHILHEVKNLDFFDPGIYLAFLQYGIFNAGFFAIRNTTEGMKFLNWWAKYMFTECKAGTNMGHHHDQNWLNYAPAIFSDNFQTITHDGYNVAPFNLHERGLTEVNGQYIVNNKYPLVIYHFTGYRIDIPDTMNIRAHYANFEMYPNLKIFYNKYYSLWKNAVLLYNENEIKEIAPIIVNKISIREFFIKVCKKMLYKLEYKN